MQTKIATLAGGCFWCLEAVFDEVNGIHAVESGYTGGHIENPDYQTVCSGATGHAEAIQITFDPEIISYKELLEIFFSIHDPTTLNRQGADIGTQYRSAIFYHDDEQRDIATQVIIELNTQKIWDNPIITQVEKLEIFYPAENYHQKYFTHNPYQPYCQGVVAPKVAKFRKNFLAKLKNAPK